MISVQAELIIFIVVSLLVLIFIFLICNMVSYRRGFHDGRQSIIKRKRSSNSRYSPSSYQSDVFAKHDTGVRGVTIRKHNIGEKYEQSNRSYD